MGQIGKSGAGEDDGGWEDVGASAEEPPDRGQRAGCRLGSELGDVEEGEAGDAAGGDQGGGNAEGLDEGDDCCGGHLR